MLSHDSGEAGEIAFWTNASTWAQPIAILIWMGAATLICATSSLSYRARILLGLAMPLLGLSATFIVDAYLFSGVQHIGGVLSADV
jgi:hypothetical protein